MFQIPLCECTKPGWCPHYNIELVGRLWELSRMENAKGDAYRSLWLRRKAERLNNPAVPSPNVPGEAPTPRPPCNCRGNAK